MSNSTRPGKLLMLAVFLLSSTAVTAQQQHDNCVLAAGGVEAANTTTRLTATFGQPIIGTSSTTRLLAHQGFWVPANSHRISSIEAVAGLSQESTPTLQCLPNPVASSATIVLKTPTEDPVTLTLHDPLGREIRSLIDHENRSGETRITFNTDELSSGWYTLILSAGNHRVNLPVHIVQ